MTAHRISFYGFGRVMALLLAVTASPAFSQETDWNAYYRFPVSLELEYQMLSPFGEYGSSFNVYEASGMVRVPIPSLPILQPALRLGMIRFDSTDESDPARWDHTHWLAGLGLTASNRFAKSFELAAELLCGGSYAVFSGLSADGPVAAWNLYAEAGARISLNPSYNLAVNIHPSLRYLHSLSPLTDFNGLIFGVGFAASMRFGQDPDAANAIMRHIRFGDPKMAPVFSAMQSWYVKNPIGTITITNTEKTPLSDLVVSFNQPGFMDSPTKVLDVKTLGPGETRTVALTASYNQNVFTTEGVTPLTGEVIVAYTAGGRAAEQRQSVTYDLHDKTAITWDDDRKVAAFITPADSALRNYASYIRQACKEAVLPAYSERLQNAMQVFTALGEIGCLYQPDPSAPFTSLQGNPEVVDSISLPRGTLSRATGDCDDLTVLYCSILETLGIDTAFITVPGHIFAAFNTAVPVRSYRDLHPDRSQFISVDGELWVPVEITLIGRTGFLEAWRKGTEEWAALDGSPEKRGFYATRKAQEVFRPVGLRETDLGLQYGRKEAIRDGFAKDKSLLVTQLLAESVRKANADGKKEDYNRLGIACARLGEYAKAEAAFAEARKRGADYAEPMINLGNVRFLKGDNNGALSAYADAESILARKSDTSKSVMVKVQLNMSTVLYQLARYDEAKQRFDKAAALDTEAVKELAYLGQGSASQGTTRAAESVDPKRAILFADEQGEEAP